MKAKTNFTILLVIFVIILLPGCIGVNRQFSEVKDKIMGKLGDDYKTEYQFSVGSVGITISSWFINFAAKEEYVDDMMREISSVQVGVYNRIEASNTKADYGTLESINEEMSSRGWKYIVRFIDGDELTAIYINAEPDAMLKKIYLINMNEDELVIVEINGDLKKVISYAIEEKSFKIKT